MDDESGEFMERAEVTGIGRSKSEMERPLPLPPPLYGSLDFVRDYPGEPVPER